jgi:glycosyltransferase involved in cell wall biosynthesis
MVSRSKIKLLIFIPTLECGGMEKYTSLLCNNINTDIFEVCLVVLNNANPFFKITNKSVVVIDLQVPHVRFAFFKIRSTIESVKPDIVFTTGNHLNLYIAIFRRFISRKVKVVGRETSIVSYNNKRAKFPVLYNFLVKKFYSNLDFIISQSVFMEKDLISNYNIAPEKSMVIYNPVDSDFNEIKEDPVRKSKGFKFITVARLSAVKGHLRLLESVSLLDFPFTYYIIGGGKMHTLIQLKINELQLQDRVFLLGSKVNPFADMEDADLFLIGSYHEGLGNVLLEAGSRGIPVVAFDAPGGISDVIQEGENGLLVPDNDNNAFADAIHRALQLDMNRNKIIETTKRRFSVNNIIPVIEKLFLKLAQNK